MSERGKNNFNLLVFPEEIEYLRKKLHLDIIILETKIIQIKAVGYLSKQILSVISITTSD